MKILLTIVYALLAALGIGLWMKYSFGHVIIPFGIGFGLWFLFEPKIKKGSTYPRIMTVLIMVLMFMVAIRYIPN